jgi:DNA-directed RNA polymerase subunit beta'
MRTFHIGGTATRISEQSKQDAKSDGFARYIGIQTVRSKANELIAMNRNGIMAVVDDKGREKERYPVVYGARVLAEDGSPVKTNQILLEWDPYTFSILTEVGGAVHFKDLVDGLTLQEQVDEVTGMSQLVVTDSPDEKRQPTIEVRPEGTSAAARGERKKYLMPTHAHLMVRDSEEVHAGDVLAKIPRETTKTKDITGGLPRVVELFEARKPRETAIIAEINGVVKYGEVTKGQRKIFVVGDDGEQREYSLPRGVHINVQEGERVKAGEPLMDGPRNPHDILDVLGEKELQKYLVNEIQEVYRLQGVNINDKHLEVISRQMMRWVKVEDIGDTEFLPEEVVDKFKFRAENQKVIEAGGHPAQGKAVLLGITKASLSTDSFISAASFQETTRVLTEAAINGKVDNLRGLKENVIMGRLVPAGTGMEYYRKVKIAGEDVVEEPVAEPTLESIPGYDEEARIQYAGGLPEDTGEESLAE